MEEKVFKDSPVDKQDNCFTLLCDHSKVNSEMKAIPTNFTHDHRVPPVCSLSEVITPKKLHLFQMDLFSPKKEDSQQVTTPRHKRRASDSHTSLTPALSGLFPTKAKRSRLSSQSDSETNQNTSYTSPFKSLTRTEENDVEMNAHEVFACSPGSPSSKCKALLDEIDVSPATQSQQDGEDFLRRQTKYNIRRCHSLELRKRLIDMTNTPPSAFKKALFKKPQQPEEKSPLLRESLITAAVSGEGCSDGMSESEHHQRIKLAVDVLQSQDLIADGSREYCLPLVKGKHTDLQNIDHETMSLLVSEECPYVFDKLTIIDCRYPYEYNGGHIKGSINIYTEDAMVEFLNREIKENTTKSKTHILVFHCEFSSHRGPNLLRHLRNSDRQANIHQYPQLVFPEVYCLFGGYKEFYSHHPDLCEPHSYTPMLDEKYASDLRHFRAKAKSWAAGDRLRMKPLSF